jgi:hypothetical protein
MRSKVMRACSTAWLMTDSPGAVRMISAAARAGGVGDGEAAVGLLQRRGVVDPVAGHGDDVSALLQGVDDAVFVLRHHLGEDAHALDHLHDGRLVGVDELPVQQAGVVEFGHRRHHLAAESLSLAPGGGLPLESVGDGLGECLGQGQQLLAAGAL